MTFILSPGHRNESIFLEKLMEQGEVKRSGFENNIAPTPKSEIEVYNLLNFCPKY